MQFLRQYGTILFPVIFVISMCIAALVSPDKTFSKEEMRYLAQQPRFSVENVVTGAYRDKFEAYYCDQFPMRDFWVGIEETINAVIQQ